MALLANDMRAVFWFALIPAVLAVVCIVFGAEDRAVGSAENSARPPLRVADLRRLDRAFWGVVAVGFVFTLARFSEAFLVLRPIMKAYPLRWPLVLVATNVVYSLGAYPAGAWSDHTSPKTLLLWGLAALVSADLALAFAPGVLVAFVGITLWGAHMALTQGLLAKLVAQHSPADLRGSAFGLFNLAVGLAMLLASRLQGCSGTGLDRRRRFSEAQALRCWLLS